MAKANNSNTVTNESNETQTTATEIREESQRIEGSAELQQKENAGVAIFSKTQAGLSHADLVFIASSGILETVGVDLSAKLLDDEFWKSNEGVELNIVFESIIPFESNDPNMDDTDAAVCYLITTNSTTKEVATERVLILNSLPVSDFKKYGAGVYSIAYLGKQKSKRNAMYSYSNFKIKLKTTFQK